MDRMHFGIRKNLLKCGSVVVLNSKCCKTIILLGFPCEIITNLIEMKWNKLLCLKTWNTRQLHWNRGIQKIASTCLTTYQEILMAFEIDTFSHIEIKEKYYFHCTYLYCDSDEQLLRAPCFHLTSVLPVFFSIDQVIGLFTGFFTCMFNFIYGIIYCTLYNYIAHY